MEVSEEFMLELFKQDENAMGGLDIMDYVIQIEGKRPVRAALPLKKRQSEG